jgi:hypothetical protein
LKERAGGAIRYLLEVSILFLPLADPQLSLIPQAGGEPRRSGYKL